MMPAGRAERLPHDRLLMQWPVIEAVACLQHDPVQRLPSATSSRYLLACALPRWQKERRLTGLHKDIEELLFDPDFKGAVGE